MEKNWFEAFVGKMDLWIRRRAAAAASDIVQEEKKTRVADNEEAVFFLACWRLYVLLISTPLVNLPRKDSQEVSPAVTKAFQEAISQTPEEKNRTFLEDVQSLMSWILAVFHGANLTRNKPRADYKKNINRLTATDASIGLASVLLVSLCFQPLRLFLLTLPQSSLPADISTVFKFEQESSNPEDKKDEAVTQKAKVSLYVHNMTDLVLPDHQNNATWPHTANWLKLRDRPKLYRDLVQVYFPGDERILAVLNIALDSDDWQCNKHDLWRIVGLFDNEDDEAHHLRFTSAMRDFIRPPPAAAVAAAPALPPTEEELPPIPESILALSGDMGGIDRLEDLLTGY